MRIALVFLFLLCGIGAYGAESQPPSPTPGKVESHPQKQKETEQTKSSYDKRGTKDFPFYVETLISIIEKSERDRATKQQEYATSINWRIMLFTGGLTCIAFFQLWFFYWQLRMMKRTAKVSEIAAIAAEKTAQAMYLGERAYVFVTIRLSFKDGDIGVQKGKLAIEFKNHGKTSAILTKIYAREIISDICPTDLIETPDTIMPPGIAIGSGECNPCDLSFSINTDLFEKVKRGEIKWFCYGCIEYVDIFRKPQKTGYCWEFIKEKGYRGFMASKNEDLNYYT